MLIAENQKIAYADRRGKKVDSSWKSVAIEPELVLWWLLVIGGLITTQYGSLRMSDAMASNGDYMTGITAVSIGSLMAALGVLIGVAYVSAMNEKLTA
jgi:hypothetical protein